MTQTLSKNIIADFETQLAVKMAIGATTGTLVSATDDDGVALPTGTYFLTLDKGNSKKEYIKCTLTGTALTAVQSVSRQGAITSGTAREHRVGANVIISDFAGLSKINDVLTGVTSFDSATPLGYDGTATISTANQFATKTYVDSSSVPSSYLDTDGTLAANSDVKVASQKATKTYADTKLSKAGGTMTAALILSTSSPSTSLEAASKGYADGLAIAGSPDSSTSVKGIGRVSVAPASPTTPIFVGDNDPRVPTQAENDALAGTGTPSGSNKYVTADTYNATFKFGDGSDGDVTISSPTTLTRDMYYNNLVVTDTLTTNGWMIFVKGTVSGVGNIKFANTINNGADGSGTSGGAGGAASVTGGHFQNVAGGNGGDGRINPIGFDGTAGASSTASIGSAGSTGGRGAGGDGGGGPAPSGGGAGGASSIIKKFGVFAFNTLQMVDTILAGSTVNYKMAGSGGGGGGGGDGGGYSGRGGGGGGMSGGIIFICANTWAGTFTISNVGGNGGNGVIGTQGDGGGGAGGQGGVNVIVYGTKTWTGTHTLTGGTGGTGWESGANGATGTSYEIDMATLTR
jgi:hypothetical protein